MSAGARVAWFWVAAIFYACSACSRDVEIYDEPDARIDPDPEIKEPDGGIPEVEDSGLDDPDFPACAERPLKDCTGANDFPCGFDAWVVRSAEACQRATGCEADDWLAVNMGDDGCVSSLGMVKPRDEFVACLVALFGETRCDCREAARKSVFLGIGNDGCADAGPERCMGGEFPCPKGKTCVDGFCVEGDGGL